MAKAKTMQNRKEAALARWVRKIKAGEVHIQDLMRVEYSVMRRVCSWKVQGARKQWADRVLQLIWEHRGNCPGI